MSDEIDDRDTRYDAPSDVEGDEYLLEHRARFRRCNMVDEEESKETEPKMEAAPPASYIPATDPLMQFFSYSHLRPELATISKPFCELAKDLTDHTSHAFLPRNSQRTRMLEHLLEAKDCAVRASIMK